MVVNMAINQAQLELILVGILIGVLITSAFLFALEVHRSRKIKKPKVTDMPKDIPNLLSLDKTHNWIGKELFELRKECSLGKIEEISGLTTMQIRYRINQYKKILAIEEEKKSMQALEMEKKPKKKGFWKSFWEVFWYGND